MIKGLRTTIYRTMDLDRSKEWYASILDRLPYFDEPFYVGFDVDGYELGLQPLEPGSPRPEGGAIAYWGVDDADAALGRMLGLGAMEHEDVQDVGDGIRVATVLDPDGNTFGIIENPHFSPGNS